MRRGVPAGCWLVVAVLALPLFAADASGRVLRPFGHNCARENGVRFCPTATSAQRVSSFDGVPLDVDVTLPRRGDGPFPALVLMHGYGGNKTNFETEIAAGPDPNQPGGSNIYHYNNIFYARRGYAVITYSARGFGNSCGGGPSGDHSGPCGEGYIRLADSRYEVRDTQHLLGLLADQRIIKPRRIGVSGISYGGGQSMELAFLRDLIRKPNGQLAPWRSPKGRRMAIRAAYPRWPWSDLVDALSPNGRFLDTEVARPLQSLRPFGVPIQSYINGLYLVGQNNGYYCGGAPASSPCTNPQADITRNRGYIDTGAPLSAAAQAAFESVYRNNGAYAIRFLRGAPTPAPLLIEVGWTDDLLPPSQALRVYNYLRSRDRKAKVSLQLGDLGHSRGSNKPRLNRVFNDRAARFFAAHLRGRGAPPDPGSVAAFTQTCPLAAPVGRLFTARSWQAIHPGKFRFGSSPPQTFTSAGGDPAVAEAFDPILGTSSSCRTIPTAAEPNVATYQRLVGREITMLGLPTIRAEIATSGDYGQIAARLWDVSPRGTQLLVSRGVYSLTNGQTGRVAFQLHGNGYLFAAGHTVRLELLGRDAPYYQPGNFPFSVEVSKLSVTLPTVGR